MPMDRPSYFSSSSDIFPLKGSTVVLSIECLNGSSKADEWTGDMLQTGDIVEELRIGNLKVRSPFKNGKSGIQRVLHGCFKQKETLIRVRVRRGFHEFAEMQACIVPGGGGGGGGGGGEQIVVGRKQYVLRAIDDPNYTVGFVDRTESECLNLQASRSTRMVSALEKTTLQDGYVSYPWARRMREMLAVPGSSGFCSILFLPIACTHYHDLEDTLAHAHAWFNAAQASGAPIVFINIQTESLLTKISGDTASSRVNAGSLSNIGNTSVYGFEDYHGVDIGVVRAVRLWFSPLAGEIPVEIRIKDTDTKLGFAISRTEEGFIYISSVIENDEDAASSRSGLNSLYRQASQTSRLLVVSRVSNQKILPWMVSQAGAIRCYDTISLSQKLSLHRHTRVPILLHVFLWDKSVTCAGAGSIRARAMSAAPLPSPMPEVHQLVNESREPVEEDSDDDEFEMGDDDDDDDMVKGRDSVGDFSFRLRDLALENNWV